MTPLLALRENARPGVGAIRKQSRESRNPEKEELRLDSWIQITSTGWDERNRSSSVLLARRPPAFHWKTLRVRGRGEEAGGIEERPEARDGGEGAERKDTKWADEG